MFWSQSQGRKHKQQHERKCYPKTAFEGLKVSCSLSNRRTENCNPTLFSMKLYYWVFLVLGLAVFSHFKLFWELSFFAHKTCLEILQPSVLGQSFICGTSLGSEAQSFKKALTQLGLIHLIIVSGSHLFFLRKILAQLLPATKSAKNIEIACCFLYGAICWWDPPVTRASFQVLVTHVSRTKKWNLSQSQMVFWAGCLTLLIFPSWSQSLSFLLSWLASLSLCVNNHPWQQSALCFFVLTPALIPLGSMHPISILANIFLGPLLGVSLVPVSLGFALGLDNFVPLAAWEQNLMKIFQWFGDHAPPRQTAAKSSFWYTGLWLYLGGVTILSTPTRLFFLTKYRRDSPSR